MVARATTSALDWRGRRAGQGRAEAAPSRAARPSALRGSYGRAPQPAVRRGVRLVLPRELLARRAGCEVVHEQGGHQRVGRARVEHLDAEAVRPRVGRGQRAVLDDRAGAGGRGDLERHRGALGPRRGRPPALEALGEQVVGALLEHDRVVDAGVLAGHVVAAQQPPAGQRAQRPAQQLRGAPVGVGLRPRRRPPRPARRRRRSGWRGTTSRVGAGGAHRLGERVDGGAHPHVGGAVGVDVVADDERPGQPADPARWRSAGRGPGRPRPAGRGRTCRGWPGTSSRPARRSVSPSSRVHRSAAGAGRRRRRWRPSAAASAAGPSRRPRRARRRCALEAQPLGVVEHRADRLAQGRLDDAGGHPGVELAAQVVAAQPVAPVGDGERRLGARPRRRASRWPAGRRGCRRRRRARLEPHLPAVGVAPAHPVVDRGEAGVGDGDGILGSGEPGLDEAAEVGR